MPCEPSPRLTAIFAFIHRNAGLVIAAWAIVLVLAAGFTASLRLDTGSLAFFPDFPPEVGRMATDMDMTPFSRLLFVDLALAPNAAEGPERLAEAADLFLGRLPKDMVTLAGLADDVVPQPDKLLSLVPATLPDLAALNSLLKPGAAEKALAAIRESLTFAFGGHGAWIRNDPFNWRQALLTTLPISTALPMPDAALGYALSRDKRHVLLALKPSIPMHDVDGAIALMQAVNASLAALPEGVTSTVVGGHRHTAVNSTVITGDIARLVTLSFAGFAVIYLMLVRSMGAVWLVLAPAAAALCATGAMLPIWPVVSGLALGFGASILGLAEDYAVHVHFALRTRSAAAPEQRMALLAPPLVQALVMNCAGFAVLLYSSIPAVRQLAFFAMATLAAGLALALTVLPLCPWFSDPPLQAPNSTSGVAQQPALRRIVPVAAILLLGLALLYPRVHVDVSPRALGADMPRLEADAARLQSVWGEALRSSVLVVHGPDADTVSARVNTVVELLRTAKDGSEEVLSLAGILPPPDLAKERVTRWNNWMTKHRTELLASLDAAAGQQGFTADAFAPFKRWITVPATVNTPQSLQQAGLGEMAEVFLRVTPQEARALVVVRGTMPNLSSNLPPELREAVVVLSPEPLESALLDAMTAESRLLPVVLALVVGMLVLCLRRPERILLASLPPLAALTGVVAWLAWSDTPLTLASLTALPLMLSLAMDHGLVVTHDLVEGAALNVERSMLVSSLTSILGMGLLALAQHPALLAMGQVIFIGLTLEFVTARWLLPRLCRPASNVAGGMTLCTK